MSWRRRDTLAGLAALAGTLSLAAPIRAVAGSSPLDGMFSPGWRKAMDRIVPSDLLPLTRDAALAALDRKLAAEKGDFRSRLAGAVKADCAAGRSVIADGWVLAESEVLIYRSLAAVPSA